LTLAPDMKCLVECFFEEIIPGSVEKNYNWKIEKICSDYFVVSGCPSKEVIEALGRDKISNTPLEILKKGFVKQLPKIIGEYSVEVTMLKSITSGDQTDVFRVEYKNKYH